MTGLSGWLGAHGDAIVLWAGALCTLGLYTVLYRENRVYRFFEHVFLGLSVGYGIAQAWNDVLQPKWWVHLQGGEWWYVLPAVVGLMYYFVYSNRHAWLARLVIGFFLGVASGQTFQAFASDTWPQIASSFKPLAPRAAAAGHKAITWPDAINNMIFMVILLLVMSYFFFSFEQKHPMLKGSAKLGRWLLMFSFGAIFGSTVMARLALLIDRVDFLLNEFGPHIGGPGAMFAILVLLAAVMIFLAKRYPDPDRADA